jgi:uncharacterized coiled-coil DUF342 family protein
MLRVVELPLRSLQTADYSTIQDVLNDINGLHSQASAILSELDILIEKVQSTKENLTMAYPKVSKWSWLRQTKTLGKLQSQIRNTTNALSTTMAALSTIQTGILQR